MSVEYTTEEIQVTPNDILKSVTQCLKEDRFPTIPTPQFLYAFFRAACVHFGVENYTTYTSTALTSGGAARPNAAGERLPFGVALAKNETFSTGLVDAIIADNPDHITEESHVNPINLGKIPLYRYEHYGTTKVVDSYWGQGDYLREWLAVIAGVEATDVSVDPLDHAQATYEVTDALFEAHRELTAHLEAPMNDYALSNKLRVEAYNEFTDTFIGCLLVLQKLGRVKMRPVDNIVGLIDDAESLGSNAEKRLGSWLGASALRAAVSGADWASTSFAVMAEELREFKAEFSVPVDKIILALIPKLPTPTATSTQLNETATERVAGMSDVMWDELVAQSRESVAPAVHGDDTDDLVALLAVAAASITRDKRAYLHPSVLEEVVGRSRYHPNGVARGNAAIENQVSHVIAGMRDPNYVIY